MFLNWLILKIRYKQIRELFSKKIITKAIRKYLMNLQNFTLQKSRLVYISTFGITRAEFVTRDNTKTGT